MQSFFVKKLLIPKIQTSGKYRKHRHSLMLQLRPFWKIPSLVGQVFVGMVIVINSEIGGFSCVHSI